MSVYKHSISGIYHYDFQVKTLRFHGSTGTKNKRAAERFEANEKRAAAEGRGRRPAMTTNQAFERFYREVAQHQASAYHADYQLEKLLKGLGNKFLSEVEDDDIATYIAQRRNEVADSSVNRETQLLRRVFRHADLNWRADIGDMPNWKRHILPEPQGRVRELTRAEEDRLFGKLRPDFHPLIQFALMSGARLTNCIRLTWKQIDYEEGEIRFRVKSRRPGGKLHIIPLTTGMKVLLAAQRGDHPIYVFTYVCAGTIGNRIEGQRYPFSATGWRRVWKKALEAAAIEGFRFHDLRHTTASRVMRANGNLAVVQELLGHEDIATTRRYAHVTKDDVRRALEDSQSRNSPEGKISGSKKDGFLINDQ